MLFFCVLTKTDIHETYKGIMLFSASSKIDLWYTYD